ncbi:hypothetical protein FRC04_008079 [Tulasnella sp. 424]|nr:hypothetical protein FRC04_008079 [Tulasnella sp. 424]KAG8974737.1 hypothetical protein FRC05_006897 [Tulasnella sp. 425]
MSNQICPLLVQQRLSELRDIQTTSTLLQEQEKQLLHVNKDLEMLERLIAKRLADRDSILERMEINRSLIAPIRNLPSEILGMIFFEYAADSDNFFPHILALVCRRWRDVTYGTPAVWSFLYLTPNNADCPPEVHLSYLDRVGNYPLSVTVNLRSVHGLEDNLAWAEWLRDHLLPHSLLFFEITNLDFGAPFKAILPFFELLSTERTKTRINAFLIHFECTFPAIDGGTASTASQALAATSKLTDLAVPLDILHPSDGVLKQLIRLRLLLSEPSLNASGRVEAVLRECPRLESLTLENDLSNSPGAAITLPHLRYLCIKYTNSLSRTFKTLRTPNLQQLELENIRGSAPELTDGINAFLQQGGSNACEKVPRLTHLTLDEAKCPERTLVRMLERLDALQVLRIKNTPKVRTLLPDALTRRPASRKGRLCPRLEGIELENCWKLKKSQIETLVEARGAVEEWRWGRLHWVIVDGHEYVGSQS